MVNWDTWGSALQAWTGSTQFNRDLRRWAEKRFDLSFSPLTLRSGLMAGTNLNRGWILDAGGLRSRETDKVEIARSEKELFRILELDWIRELTSRYTRFSCFCRAECVVFTFDHSSDIEMC